MKHICGQCGNEFIRYGNKPAKYCSKLCYGTAMQSKITVICCGCQVEFEIIPSRLKWSKERGRGKIYCNAKCKRASERGSGHPHWITDRTKLSDRRHSERNTVEYREWRAAVFARDNYTCQDCGKRGGYLHAHHDKDWNSHPELRYNVGNGVTLCHQPCHKNRHKHSRYNAKLDMADISELRMMRIEEGLSYEDLAYEFDVSISTAWKLCGPL